jgi:hypothetical protein
MTHPGDGRLDLIGEEGVIQHAIDSREIEVMSLWLEPRRERLGGWSEAELVLVVPEIRP